MIYILATIESGKPYIYTFPNELQRTQAIESRKDCSGFEYTEALVKDSCSAHQTAIYNYTLNRTIERLAFIEESLSVLSEQIQSIKDNLKIEIAGDDEDFESDEA
jgi:hypothetical protein